MNNLFKKPITYIVMTGTGLGLDSHTSLNNFVFACWGKKN